VDGQQGGDRRAGGVPGAHDQRPRGLAAQHADRPLVAVLAQPLGVLVDRATHGQAPRGRPVDTERADALVLRPDPDVGLPHRLPAPPLPGRRVDPVQVIPGPLSQLRGGHPLRPRQHAPLHLGRDTGGGVAEQIDQRPQVRRPDPPGTQRAPRRREHRGGQHRLPQRGGGRGLRAAVDQRQLGDEVLVHVGQHRVGPGG
jgi:hypothetical protein